MPINPGKLNRLVTLRSKTRTPDGAGGFTLGTPTVFARVWAQVEPTSSEERVLAEQRDADITHRVTIRFLPGVSAAMEVLLESARILDIVTAPYDPSERREFLVFDCLERVG